MASRSRLEDDGVARGRGSLHRGTHCAVMPRLLSSGSVPPNRLPALTLVPPGLILNTAARKTPFKSDHGRPSDQTYQSLSSVGESQSPGLYNLGSSWLRWPHPYDCPLSYSVPAPLASGPSPRPGTLHQMSAWLTSQLPLIFAQISQWSQPELCYFK